MMNAYVNHKIRILKNCEYQQIPIKVHIFKKNYKIYQPLINLVVNINKSTVIFNTRCNMIKGKLAYRVTGKFPDRLLAVRTVAINLHLDRSRTCILIINLKNELLNFTRKMLYCIS